MKKSIQIISIVIILQLVGQSCQKESIVNVSKTTSLDCKAVSSTFTKYVLPIFTTNCALSGCHNAASKAEGLVFESYSQIKSCLGRATKSIASGSMPRGRTLSATDLNTIQCWINSGTPNN